MEEFRDIFPHFADRAGPLWAVFVAYKQLLTVMTKSQKEQRHFIEAFSTTAAAFCDELRSSFPGEFADCINPITMMPSLSPPGVPLSEADQRYLDHIFQAVPVGCCTALSHTDCETCHFVGILFATVPPAHFSRLLPIWKPARTGLQ